MPGKTNKQRATETEKDRCSQLGLTNLVEFIFYLLAAVVSYLGYALFVLAYAMRNRFVLT